MMSLTRFRWMPESRGRQVALLIVAAVLLPVVATMAWQAMFRPVPPDIGAADARTLADFLVDPSFLELTSAERERFLRGLASRYMTMTPQERQAFEDRWRQGRRGAAMRRQIEVQMSLAMLRHMSESYFELPVEERQAYLDRVILVIELTDSRFRREYHHWLNGSPLAQTLTRPGRIDRDVGLFRDVLSATNVDERASFYQFAGDLLDRGRQRRGTGPQ